MITLFDNPFSPFTRKVRMALAWKQLEYRRVDGLALAEREALLRLNPRGEVPLLDDDGLLVTSSAEILAYLDDRYPAPPLLPTDVRQRVRAREWQRLADTTLDAISHDLSLWMWPTIQRSDAPPPGLVDAGLVDYRRVLDRMEAALDGNEFLCGPLSVADLAVFPHVSAMRVLGHAVDATRLPRVDAWGRRMRAVPAVRQDLDYLRATLLEQPAPGAPPRYEAQRVGWRGDRLEWLFARGYFEWFRAEHAADRVVFPSPI